MARDNLSTLFGARASPPCASSSRSIDGASSASADAFANNNFDRDDDDDECDSGAGGGSSRSATTDRGNDDDDRAQPPSSSRPTRPSSSSSARSEDAKAMMRPAPRHPSSASDSAIDDSDDDDGPGAGSHNGGLQVDWPTTSDDNADVSPDASSASAIGGDDESSSTITKPGTESIRALRRFGSNLGSIALKPLRELQLAEKLNAMNLEMEEVQERKERERTMRLREAKALEAQDRERGRRHQQQQEEEEVVGTGRAADESNDPSERSARAPREEEDEEDEEECERIKREADEACRRVAGRYDALLKFLRSCPRGTYEEYVEFLLMGGGGGVTTDDAAAAAGLGEDYDSLMFENFYDETSEYRKLWNDNLTTGLPEGASTVEGRSFVRAAGSAGTAEGDRDAASDPWKSIELRQRSRTFSEDEKKFGRTLRERTLSEGDRLKKQIAAVDKRKIKRGLGSAIGALSNASAFALKPLRDLQIAEQINARNLDMEEERTRREIERYNRLQEEDRDMEEMMRLKREAEEVCLKATEDHLLGFVRDNPDATYNQWIEVFHPENAHEGGLLEGLGKTIDHRFFVEESDHRRLWNENLSAFLDPSAGGRDFVPGRASQRNDDGEAVVAADILSGTVAEGECAAPQKHNRRKSEDLIAFD